MSHLVDLQKDIHNHKCHLQQWNSILSAEGFPQKVHSI